jgi:molybdopterin-guanine dinucleotide biosynthesis protein A
MTEPPTLPQEPRAATAGRRLAGIPGVILAGGRSVRMGGGDKCLRTIAGRRLIDHVVARLAPQVDGLALNANGDPARFADLGLPVLADECPDHAGPLAGVLAGLDWAAARGAAAIVTAAADTPFFPPDLAVRLAAAAGPTGLAVAASRDATGRVQRHPTFGLWPVALRGALRAALSAGTRKLMAWIEAHGAGTAVFPAEPLDPFFNVNTPEDAAAAEAMAVGAA